jgi:hypothetical protein
MQVIPVAGYDSMLLNLSGAHGPHFTRIIVILTDDAGHSGVGEIPAGARIQQTLEDAKALVVGQSIGMYRSVLDRICKAFADRDGSGRWPFRPRGAGRVSPRHRNENGHQHGGYRLAATGACGAAASGGHPTGRSALLDAVRLGTGGPSLSCVGVDLGLPFQQPFRHLAGHVHSCRRGGPRAYRDDAAPMRYLIADWGFDPKRPCLVR